MDGTVLAAIITAMVSAWIAYGGWSQADAVARKQREADVTAREHAEQIEKLRADLERSNEEAREQRARQNLVGPFREQLATAAFDLQSRLYNILRSGFFEAYASTSTNPRHRTYAINNTLYLICQWFAWAEIIRQEINYVERSTDQETRDLSHCIQEINRAWRSDRIGAGTKLMVWAGEQRQIGEGLIVHTDRGRECMGYGTFLAQLTSVAPDHPLHAVRGEIEQMIPSPSDAAVTRLRGVQHGIIKLLHLLDPDSVRFAPESREKA